MLKQCYGAEGLLGTLKMLMRVSSGPEVVHGDCWWLLMIVSHAGASAQVLAALNIRMMATGLPRVGAGGQLGALKISKRVPSGHGASCLGLLVFINYAGRERWRKGAAGVPENMHEGCRWPRKNVHDDC